MVVRCHMKIGMWWTILLLACSFSIWPSVAKTAGRTKKKAAKVSPSANAGKMGQYTVKSSIAGCNYHVFVPNTYSETNPAGLHLFFSGQGGCATNSSFHQWDKYFLTPFNLIGINMQYPDGDNTKNTDGKAKSALLAVLQVQADYKIVVGRGAVGSFSGGGYPHGVYYKLKGKEIGASWPFLHQGHYGSNYRHTITPTNPIQSLFVGVGTEEWSLASLGSSGAERFIEALRVYEHPEVYYQVMKHGHSVTSEEVAASALMFRRMDIAYAPFVYAPDYVDAKLRSAVKAAGSLKLGEMHKAIENLKADERAEAEIKNKAGKLQELLDKRVDAIVSSMTALCQNDLFLADHYYSVAFKDQFRGHPKEAELKKLVNGMDRTQLKAARKTYKRLDKELPAVFRNKSYKLERDHVKLMEAVRETMGEKSLFGGMAAELLQVQ